MGELAVLSDKMGALVKQHYRYCLFIYTAEQCLLRLAAIYIRKHHCAIARKAVPYHGDEIVPQSRCNITRIKHVTRLLLSRAELIAFSLSLNYFFLFAEEFGILHLRKGIDSLI